MVFLRVKDLLVIFALSFYPSRNSTSSHRRQTQNFSKQRRRAATTAGGVPACHWAARLFFLLAPTVPSPHRSATISCGALQRQFRRQLRTDRHRAIPIPHPNPDRANARRARALMIFRRFDAMSQLLLSILGLSVAMPHCPMWQDIKPCTCRTDSSQLTSISCEKIDSFEQIVNVFRGHFAPTDRVSFRLSYSNIDDLRFRSFKELNMSIENLKLNHDNIV